MSTTVDVVGSSNGCLGTSRNVIYAVNSGYWWVFAFDSTNLLSTYYSSNGITWLAGATYTLANAHVGEGRNFSVGYKNISGVDVVHIAIVFQNGTSLGLKELRATINGTTITFHSVEKTLNAGNTDNDSMYWCGSSIEFASNNKVHVGCGWADTINGAVAASDSSADAGTPEQMTLQTWTGDLIDNSLASETRSNYMFDSGSTTMGLISDNASSAATMTALQWSNWTGTTWANDATNTYVTGGTITAIDRNDWGAVARTIADCHVVYRTATGSWQHRRWAGGISWVDGDLIPALATTSGTGVALATDGTNVWLAVIAADAANSIRCIRWQSGIGWDLAWTVLEPSTATRSWVSCARDMTSGNLTIIWHEGTTLKAGYIGGAAAIYYYPYWFNAMRIM
jgi:hypothetical protein